MKSEIREIFITEDGKEFASFENLLTDRYYCDDCNITSIQIFSDFATFIYDNPDFVQKTMDYVKNK